MVDSFHEDGKCSIRSTALKSAVSTCGVGNTIGSWGRVTTAMETLGYLSPRDDGT